MEIIKITTSFFYANSYILVNSQGEAILIDSPPESAEQILQILKQKDLLLKKIILTHGHWDHICDASKIKMATQAKIFIHNMDSHYLSNKKSHDFMMLPIVLDVVEPDFLLVGGENISLGEIELNVIHTPGHTSGGICLYSERFESLFSGDTLFQTGIGRTDFPDGNHSDIISSIREKLFILPDSTEVFPGHGDKTTIQYEKKYNPFLR
jgi:glyoxylase-like metal-dependent hydrolase (beta-lactamase superfamily II)